MGAMKTMDGSVFGQETQADPVAGRSIADRVYRFIENNDIAVLGFLLILVTAFSLVRSHHKQFWYDEIFTIIVSAQPDLHHFAAAMPPEGNPPLNTFLTRLVIKAFGISQVSVRLVPLFGFLTALAGVYIFVRREAGKVLGILAVVLLLFGPVWEYSYEARPYAILMGAFMVALVSWQEATRIKDRGEQRSRSLALCGMALGILLCTFSHYIGLIEIGFPLLVGEAVRSYYRRRIDWPLVATGVCCLPSLLLIMPMMARTRNTVITNSTVLQPPITMQKIFGYLQFGRSSWHLVMDDRIIALVLLVALITWIPSANRSSSFRKARTMNTHVRTYVLWACIAASFLIPVTWIAMVFGKGWYFCRYGIGSALGIVLCFCLILARRRLCSPAFIVGLIFAVGFQYVLEFEREVRVNPDLMPANRLIETENSNLPIVILDAFTYPTIWWYSPAAKKPEVVYISTPINKGDLVSETLMAEKPYFQAPLSDFKTFTLQNPHFLLELEQSGMDGPTDTRKLLEADGYVINRVRADGTAILFDVDRRAGKFPGTKQ
jgi:hypothetical protein